MLTKSKSADIINIVVARDYNVRRHSQVVRQRTANPLPPVRIWVSPYAGVAELADAQDLKSCGGNTPYRFDSGLRQ